ncbi:Transcription initiation factor TFIID subunit 12 [Tilletia horrida]|uniref:TBP-associated factor 12 n=1 Tax=Tilletia horrida TaxID=155126 RepID=A0AAN6GN56_9BASI|nr:Transcription initiation factor TFIID subunit 12 [Tilletia horrida]KAK0549719.1 Transcription initiation factor TFIID subunit 12 [Tilletia horrida]KAK0569929.1 Transcription initiation factor TFIID subunit 12 [Tilletia horrida]
MNPNQQQPGPGGAGQAGPSGAGNGPGGIAGAYARQMHQATHAAMRQAQAQQAMQGPPQPVQQQQQQQAAAVAQGQPAAAAGAAQAPGLDQNALTAIQNAIQGAVNDPARMQSLLSSLVASGRINPTQLAQIRAMLAKNAQSANTNAPRPATQTPPVSNPPAQQAINNVAASALAPQQQQAQALPQAGPSGTVAPSAAAGSAAAMTPAARLAQIEAELRNETTVNNDANAAADHVSQRIAELEAALATLPAGSEARQRVSQQRQEEQNKLAHVGSRFMEAKKYYDDLRAQRAALRAALSGGAAAGSASPSIGTNVARVGASPAPAATQAVASAANNSPAPGTVGIDGAGAAPSATVPATGGAGTTLAGSTGVNPASLMAAGGAGGGSSTAGTAADPTSIAAGAGGASAAASGAGAQQGSRGILIPLPQPSGRIEVTGPPPTGEAFPASRGPRPTLNQGLAAPNPVVATPSTLSRPEMISSATSTSDAANASSAPKRAASPTIASASNWEELLGVAARENVKMGVRAPASGSDDFEVVSVTPGPGVASSTFYNAGAGSSGAGVSTPTSSSSQSAPNRAVVTRPSQAPAGSGGYVTTSSSSFNAALTAASQENRLLNKRKVQELVGEIDAGEQLEDDVEDLLLEIADEFIESVTHFACKLAKHRRAEKLEVKDVQLHLERNWNIRVPFPGTMPIPPPRTRPAATTSKGGGANSSSNAAAGAS